MEQGTRTSASEAAASSGPHLHHEVRDGNGPYLLMLHGMFSNREQWAPNLDGLSAFVRPVLLELWGHGRSPTPASDQPYTAAGYVAEFERIRELLGAERVFVCGQSFSAGLILRYGLMHPERIIGQTFTNSVSGLAPADRAGSLEEREAKAQALLAEGRAGMEKIPYHPIHARRLPESVKRRLLDAANETSPEGIAQGIRVTGPDLSVLADLPRISRPTLLVNGMQEKAFQPYRDLALRDIPDCRVVDLPAGHAVNLEVPDMFNEAVKAFVEEWGSRGR